MNNIYMQEINTCLNAFDTYKLFSNEKYSFLLDSGRDTESLGRYSFMGSNPFLTIEAKNSKILVDKGKEKIELDGNPFVILNQYLNKYKVENQTTIPFIGGAVGFLSYDLCHHVEVIPRNAVDDIHIPDMIMGFYDLIIVFDNLEEKVFVVSICFSDSNMDIVKEKVASIKEKIEKSNEALDTSHLDDYYKNNEVELVSNFTFENYCKAIEKAKKYIYEGDIFQMNMTQRFTTLVNRHPLNIYEHLREINPAPFAAYLNYGETKVLSSSPERFIQIRKGKVETRPIKGTMPRGKTVEEDNINMEQLKDSTKDRAENLMIVDLLRNDLGRVSKFSSVVVPEIFKIESYATVHHLVSVVTGELKPEYNTVDCLKAMFPGGSITGAPKIRAMEIIDELEPTCRNVYTGCIGYIGFDGDADWNIVIRTILMKGHRAYYQVGGGIVWDSVPEKEYQETMDKGSALMSVLLNMSEDRV